MSSRTSCEEPGAPPAKSRSTRSRRPRSTHLSLLRGQSGRAPRSSTCLKPLRWPNPNLQVGVRQEGHQHPDLARVSSSLTLPCEIAQRGGVKLSAVLFRDDVLKYGRTGDISCWKWENTVFSNTGRTFVIRSHHIAFLRSQRISPVLTVPIARRPVVLNSGSRGSRRERRSPGVGSECALIRFSVLVIVSTLYGFTLFSPLSALYEVYDVVCHLRGKEPNKRRYDAHAYISNSRASGPRPRARLARSGSCSAHHGAHSTLMEWQSSALRP
jgi:hypothetical protein